jgi:hypothetical protein
VPVVYAYNLICLEGRDQDDCSSRPAWEIVQRPFLENRQHKKRAVGVAEVVECLPSKHQVEPIGCFSDSYG